MNYLYLLTVGQVVLDTGQFKIIRRCGAEGRPYGIRACIVYQGGMATHWGLGEPEVPYTIGRVSSTPTGALPHGTWNKPMFVEIALSPINEGL